MKHLLLSLLFLSLRTCHGHTLLENSSSSLDQQQEPKQQQLRLHGPDFEIRVFPTTVNGLVGEQLNFSVILKCFPNNSCNDTRIHLEVNSPYFQFWSNSDTNGSREENGLKLDESSETTVCFNTSMLGIYDVQFYTILPNSDKAYLQKEEQPSSTKSSLDDVNNETGLCVIISRPIPYNQLVGILLSVLLLLALFLMGIEIDLYIILDHLRRPVGPAIGFVSQFLFMPLLSWGIGHLFLSNVYERLGLIVVGASPGGVHSNFWTSLAGGDVNLSVTMTFLSTLFSFGMTTFWIWLLNEEDQTVHIPYDHIAISLATFTIPLLAGFLFKHCQPALAERALKLLYRPLVLTCLIVFPATVCVANDYFFYLITWRHLLAGTLLGACGYLSGALLAFVCRQGMSQIIAVSLETSIQNPFVTLVIMTLSFPSPYCEMGLLSAFSYVFSVSPVLLFVYGVYLVGKGCKKMVAKMKEEDKDEKEEDEREETIGQEMIT